MKIFSNSIKRSVILTALGNSALHATVLASGQPDPTNPLLAGWWDANDPASQVALQSGTWPDRSTWARDANLLGVNKGLIPISPGISTVGFGVGSGFYNFDSINLLPATGSTASIFLVTSFFDGFPEFSPSYALGNLQSGSAQFLGVTFFGEVDFKLTPTPTLFPNGGNDLISNFAIVEIALNTTTNGQIDDFRVNGSPQSRTLSGNPYVEGASAYEISVLGGSFQGPWLGEIAEVLIFEEELSSEDKTSITSYLGDKYSVTIVPEPSTSFLILFALFPVAYRRR